MSGPIQHTVVFSLRHEAGSASERDFLDAALALATIPGVKAYRQLRQISPKRSCTHSFTMTFGDQQAYDAYNDHPVHVGFVRDRWQSEVTESQELDFALSSMTDDRSPDPGVQLNTTIRTDLEDR